VGLALHYFLLRERKNGVFPNLGIITGGWDNLF